MNSAEHEESNVLAIDGHAIRFYHGRQKQNPVLKGLDIHVERGEIYGLLGPSGCGKTTLLKCVLGHWKHTSGTIRLFGRIPGERGFFIPGRGVGYMPQELALYTEFTIEEMLTYFGRLYQMEYDLIKERTKFFLDFLDIPSKKRVIQNLSGGQQRRVSLATALIHKPPLLILDEPTVGVDPLLRQSIWEHLKTLAATEKMTIIITTHYVEEARQAHVVGLMREGRLLAEMNPENLIIKHNVATLEDVFLKLCKKDSEQQDRKNGSDENPVSQNGDINSEEYMSDVWIIRQNSPPKRKTDLPQIKYHNNIEDGSHREALFTYSIPTPGLYEQTTCLGSCKETYVRMTTLIKKGFTRLKRNIPFACVQIFLPVIEVMVFYLCVGGEVFDVPIAVVNMEAEPDWFGQKFLNSLDNHTFKQIPYSNLTLAIDAVKNGEAWGAAYVGPRFSECLFDRFLEGNEVTNKTIECSKVKLYLDMTNQLIAITTYAKFMRSFQNFAGQVMGDSYGNPHFAEAPISLEDPIYGNKDDKLSTFMAPGIIIAITYFMALALTGMIIISEKREGLLDRTWMAGVTRLELLLGVMLVFSIVMIMQSALVIIFSFAVFDVPLKGSLFLVVVCVLLVGITGMSHGLVISTLVKDESAALMASMGLFVPNILASGILWPLEGMAYWLRYLSYCLPLTLISNTVRSVAARGWDLSVNHIWDGFVACFLWTAVFLILALISFKYKK